MGEQKKILFTITPEIKADMETIHFCADLHHGHPKIVDICKRPVWLPDEQLKIFKKDERNIKNPEYRKLLDLVHNEWLVKEVINKYVSNKDELYILGDLSFVKRVEAEKFVDRLNGNKHFIPGNHDKNLKNSTRFSEVTQIKNFNFSRYGINIHIVLCHYPIASWERKVHQSWHLFGHVHGRFKNTGLSFDVGIDNPEIHEYTGGVYRPLNLYEIVEIMETKRKWYDEDIEYGED